MKLATRDVAAYAARPDPRRAGLLLYGPDAMRIALRRQQVIAALIGPEGPAEMRLTRIAPGELRGDPAALGDALRARSFFPGPRAVLLDGAGDAQAAAVALALGAWSPGDAQLIVTAGQLTPRAKLRKLFEDHPTAYAAGIYADAPGREEVARQLAAAGLADVPAPRSPKWARWPHSSIPATSPRRSRSSRSTRSATAAPSRPRISPPSRPPRPRPPSTR